ncbi:RNA-guided endonuclease InsQ/TnpB family protein [Nostoc sp.]|uniref:RNA-guided endonuclease InsQ/TnpB family protein n=1 Tax=Nostoc sp. TaxID=1180 RepID=UPI002FF751F5
MYHWLRANNKANNKLSIQVRWNYKLQPNKAQQALMGQWLVTLRKHRNYCLAERKRGFETNNQDSVKPVMYGYAAYSDIETRAEYGASCPLTCPVVKHGVMSAGLTKSSKGTLKWGSAADVQSKRTTELRSENPYYARINSDVLQGNLAKLDTAYNGFFQHKRGFPAFRKVSNFNSFQYKPGQSQFDIKRDGKTDRNGKRKDCYSHVYLPGIGDMRYLDSRAIPNDVAFRSVTVIKKADGWYISVLLNLVNELPVISLIETVKSAVGIDVGINKFISLSDGSFVENPKFSTNKKTRRQLRIRQRRINRKIKGSKNRSKAGCKVAKLHKKIADKRNDYQWKAANKVVHSATAIVQEDLNIKAMKCRCKPKREKGRFMANGQSAKRGLNRSISDASWGELNSLIAWLAMKSGKPVLSVNPKFTSQECSDCHHISKDNRDGEKFICESCGHIDHADTQASRTILRRANLKFVSIRRKNLPGDSRKVTLVSYDSASNGEQNQGRNRTSKVMPEKRILFEQLSLFN